jgi:hypothetical protein
MSLYHDNDGDNLWRIVSFDMNLSWGAIFYESAPASMVDGVQATNDNHKAFPLYGSGAALPVGSGNYNRVYDVVFRHPQLREMFLRRMRTMMDAYVKPPGTPDLELVMEKKAIEWRDLIAEDAIMDRTVWGWPGKGGQNNFDPPPNAGAFGSADRTNAAIIALTNGVDAMLTEFMGRRRDHFYVRHSITNTALPVGITKTQNAGIPLAQPAGARVEIFAIEFSPSSGDQEEEFITVTNGNPYAVDVSGWKVGGGIDFTFQLGTVIPSNSVVYVSPDVKAFRGRTVGPGGGQGLFVVGPYRGQLSARGESVYIVDDKGRGVTTNTYAGNPSLAQQFLRITEIMYNPARLAGNATDAQEFEFIELKNISTGTTLSLAGVHFINGIEFDFTGSAVTSLPAGGRVLVVKNPVAFAARYGGGQPIAGTYSGNLDNNGERIRLVDAQREEILDFDFEDDWYPLTDGLGFSLAIVDENAEPDLWDSKTNWRASGVVNGSPGQPNPPAPIIAPIRINEALTDSEPPVVDAIELYNPTTANVNIGGWYLTDDTTNAFKYRIPNNTIIPAEGYLTFTEAQFNQTPGVPPNFALSSRGDEVYLFSADANTNLTGYRHGFEFGAAETGVSFGRHVITTGDEHFVAQISVTTNAPNSGPRVGPVVISEIFYHPLDYPGGEDNADDEFIELSNISGGPVPLYDPAFQTNHWRLRGGVQFDFPPDVMLPVGGRLLLVNFDPANAGLLASFRARLSAPDTVPVFGPYSGKLDNSSDTVRLLKPDAPELGVVSYVLVEQVRFQDSTPWPTAADGSAAALHRVFLTQYGDEPTNWVAAVVSPGQGYVAGGAAPLITAHPASLSRLTSQSAVFSVVATGDATLKYQWSLNGTSIAGATSSTLILNNLQLIQAGMYRVTVFNEAGSAVSDAATLSINVPADIFIHPQNVELRGSTNAVDYGSTTNLSATFTVVATGNGPLTYQWRFNGINISGGDFVGADTPTLTVNNVQYDLHDGYYDVVITDVVGSVASSPGKLSVLLTPIIVQAPLAQFIPSNGTMSVSVVVKGNPPPFRFIWNQGSTPRGIFITDEKTNYFSYGPITNVSPQNWRIIITNAAFRLPGSNIQFPVVAVADFDQDGIPDSFENSIAELDPNNPGDADGDIDLDGMTNREEYLAGTDPLRDDSYLRVDLDGTTGAASVRVAAIATRTYTVQYTDSLDLPTWQKLGNIVARTTDREEVIPDPDWTTNRFYRVVLPAIP